MPIFRFIVMASLSISLWILGTGVATAEDQTADTSTAVKKEMPRYRPFVKGQPLRREGGGSRSVKGFRPMVQGKPVRREGGGSRSDVSTTLPIIALLSPESTGYTVSAQPDLYWFISGEWKGPVRYVLDNEDEDEPLLDETVDSFSGKTGIHALSLKQYEVKLKPDVEYQWTISLIVDPDNYSGNIVANGAIQRVEAPSDLSEQLQADTPHFVYAEQGFWFDAIATLSHLIDSSPQNKSLRRQRANLLEQVNLPTVAGFDRMRPVVKGMPSRRETGGSRQRSDSE